MISRKHYYFIFFVFIAAAVIWALFFLKLSQQKFLEVDFFDVGQGDAILVKTPKNQTMLIDGGPNDKILDKLSANLMPLQKRLDIVMLTHPHADHAAGLIEILKRYESGLLILGSDFLETETYKEFLKTAELRGIPVMIGQKGDAVHFSEDLELDILSPKEDTLKVFGKGSESFGKAGNDVNDSSVVGKLVFKNFSIVLTGDATSKTEKKLIGDYGQNLQAEILKIGHHGSKYSTSENFLKYVRPKAAIIEVGARNRYGHPAPAALERLNRLNIATFRTDEKGDIKILSDGFLASIYADR